MVHDTFTSSILRIVINLLTWQIHRLISRGGGGGVFEEKHSAWLWGSKALQSGLKWYLLTTAWQDNISPKAQTISVISIFSMVFTSQNFWFPIWFWEVEVGAEMISSSQTRWKWASKNTARNPGFLQTQFETWCVRQCYSGQPPSPSRIMRWFIFQ